MGKSPQSVTCWLHGLASTRVGIVCWGLSSTMRPAGFFEEEVTVKPTALYSPFLRTKRPLFCVNDAETHDPSTRILKTQRLKTHFLETGSQGGEIRKRSPPVLVWTVNPHTFRNDDAIAPPRPLASELWTTWRLPTTTACVCVSYSPCSRVWVAAAVWPH